MTATLQYENAMVVWSGARALLARRRSAMRREGVYCLALDHDFRRTLFT
jgi:hypothetical protein